MKLNDSLIGERFGRLVVTSDSGTRASDGSCMWICKCDCGNTHIVSTSNLKSGSVRSCRCLQKELSSARRKASALPPKKCIVDDCNNTTEKGAFGYCGMHYARYKRHGDINYMRSIEDWRKNCHNGQPNTGCCKDTTYKKNCGRHEHRVIMETILGRPLLSDEIVHHIDGNRHNNDPSNLQIVSPAEHMRIHLWGKTDGSTS